MMFRKTVFALLPLALLASTVRADDNEFDIDLASVTDASVEIVDADLAIDVDQLTADATATPGESTDAIEACFRRFGYHYGGYRSYRCNYSGWNCCRTLYSYRRYHCAPPIVRVCAPIYHCYWGCY